MAKIAIILTVSALFFGYSSSFKLIGRAEDPVIERCVVPGVLAITFDDGPYVHTQDVLDVLKEKNVTTTFFINGNTWSPIEGNLAQSAVRRAIVEGHTIGSHTWDHQNLRELTAEEIEAEMTRLSDALIEFELLDTVPNFMRPPYGSYNDEAISVIHDKLNYTMVNWSIDTSDWVHPGDTEAGVEEYRNILEGTDPTTTLGFIALHHDVQDGAPELAAAVIDYTRSQGYRFVSLEECLGYS